MKGRCLPACLNPKEGIHHLRCPNHPQAEALKEAFAKDGDKQVPSWAADHVPMAFRQRKPPVDAGRPDDFQFSARRTGDPMGPDAILNFAPASAEEMEEYRREQRRGGAGGISTRSWVVIMLTCLAISLYRTPIVGELSRDILASGRAALFAPTPSSAEEDDDLEMETTAVEVAGESAVGVTAAAPTHQPAAVAAVAPKPPKRGAWRRALRVVGIGRGPSHA